MACGASKDKQTTVKASSSSKPLGDFAIEPIQDPLTNVSPQAGFSFPTLTVQFKIRSAVHPARFEYEASAGRVDGAKESDSDIFSEDGEFKNEINLDFDPRIASAKVYDSGQGEQSIYITAEDKAGLTSEISFKVKVVKATIKAEHSGNSPTMTIETAADDKRNFKVANRLAPSCVELGRGEVYRQKTPVASTELTFTKQEKPEGGYRYSTSEIAAPTLDTEYEHIKTIIYARDLTYFNDDSSTNWTFLTVKSWKPNERDISCYADILNKPKPTVLLYCGIFQAHKPFNQDDLLPNATGRREAFTLQGPTRQRLGHRTQYRQ